jgi:hypothetical protein
MDFKARHVFFSASVGLALCGWRGKENLLNMGFRFQKRIKILPEIFVNLGIPQGEALIWKNKRESQRFCGGFQSVPVAALLYDAFSSFAAIFACLKRHFPTEKNFLRFKIRFNIHLVYWL